MKELWYDSFLEALYKKYPEKSELREALMELLSIERETAYRRLRNDVKFSIEEFVKIASAWDISLNDIVGIQDKKVSFKAEFINYFNPSDKDLNLIKKVIQHFDNLNQCPDLEYMEVVNKLPRTLASCYHYLIRFQLFKWNHQYTNEENRLSFAQNIYHSKIAKLGREFSQVAKQIPRTIFVWDHKLFEYLIGDIHYFHSIFLITDEEKEFIKKDLYNFLDYMSEVAIKGCWPETGNKVELYISYINLDTHYSYYYSSIFKECRIHAFMKSEIYSDNPVLVEDFRVWMQAKKRSSIQISNADDKSRIEFFMKQRELIDAL